MQAKTDEYYMQLAIEEAKKPQNAEKYLLARCLLQTVKLYQQRIICAKPGMMQQPMPK